MTVGCATRAVEDAPTREELLADLSEARRREARYRDMAEHANDFVCAIATGHPEADEEGSE